VSARLVRARRGAPTPAPAGRLALALVRAIRETEERLVREALELAGGRVNHAAEWLGTSRVHAHRLIRKHGLATFTDGLRGERHAAAPAG
jgi:transcriptional regulator with GAF, ATPase, and Fis domain